ncbi:hypothetical protein M758_UG065100 [Ceratodon purpureus]|nr:hypothetical protein M758_UG065100 [Ceratodon purpureus]
MRRLLSCLLIMMALLRRRGTVAAFGGGTNSFLQRHIDFKKCIKIIDLNTIQKMMSRNDYRYSSIF